LKPASVTVAPQAHVPLSQRLAQLLESEQETRAITLNLLLERTEGRGIFLVIILLCLPFVAPVTIPGSSIPFGLAVALLGLSVSRQKTGRLPKKIGDRPLPDGLRKIILGGGLKFVRWIEKSAKPRRTAWLDKSWARWVNGLLLIIWGLFLSLPLPPIPPLGNTLPSYAIILLAVSLMEEDGVLIWWAYGVSVFNIIYFACWAEILVNLFMKWGHKLAGILGIAT
jgi:hypothetical protein